MTNELANCSIEDIVFAAADEVFSSMLASQITLADQPVEREGAAYDGVLSVVGLTGKWVGGGFLTCNGPTAALLASRLLMTEMSSVDDEVLDAVGELTNMIVGSVKNGLEERLGAMQLSVPTVVYGKNIRTHLMKSQIRSTVACRGDDWEIVLRICLTKA
ncbi:MAG: chemotaxis protein CheX [Bryobacteraceae bacterium]